MNMCETQSLIETAFAVMLGFFGGIPVTLLILAGKVQQRAGVNPRIKTVAPDAITIDGKWVKWER